MDILFFDTAFLTKCFLYVISEYILLCAANFKILPTREIVQCVCLFDTLLEKWTLTKVNIYVIPVVGHRRRV